tara:strand:- start:2447 stop:5308 length:2862 start_codon:yes stop_codon:yes gene_type:complete
MTVSSTTTSVSYTGNGSTTNFAVTFPFQSTGTTAELTVVQRTIATGAETTLSYTTHYTVTGGNGTTGVVIAASAPANTVQWHFRRNTTTTQTVDYVTNDPFPADTHELALDRLAMAGQERDSDIAQALKYSNTFTGSASVIVPEPVASSFLKWNAAGDALENSTTTAAQYLSGNGTVAAPFYSYTSDPDSGSFRIGANNLGVAVNGAKVLDVATSGLGVTGTLTASSNISGVNGAFSGAVSGTTGTFSGILKTDDATDATSGTDGALQTDGGLSVVKKAFIGQTLKVIGVTTHGGDVVSDTDSTDSLGATGARWLNVWADKINNILSPTAQYTSAEATKLAAIEASADVTDATNVTAAGALMDSELTNIAAVKAINQSLVTSANPTFGNLAATNLDGIVGASTARAGTFAGLTGTVIEATTSLELASGATVTGFDATASLGSSNTLVPTQGAVKTYVDNALAASAVWQDVIYLTVSDSVYSPSASLNGRFYAVDTSGGAVTINLPQISAAGNAWALGIKKTTSDTNAITVVRYSGDEIDEIAGNITIGVHNSGRIFLADTGASPDSWTTQQFGAVGGNMTVQNYTVSTHFTAGSTTALTVSSAPASEQNIVVTFDGVTQHHDTYAISGTTVTFSSAIPTGTANVEIRWGGILAINSPGDGTVTTAKFAAGPAKDLNALAVTNSIMYVGDGSNIVAETGATLRTSIGVGTGNSPQLTGIELGHATDTTLTRVSAGVIAVEGANVVTGASPQLTGIELGHATDTTITRISAGVAAVEGAVIKTVGKESIWIPAGAMYPSTTNPCADLAQVETTALRPDLKVLDFAAAADDFAQFSIAFPKSWNEGTVTYQAFWTVTGTNTGTVVWQLGGIAVSSDDTTNTAFGTLIASTALAHSGTSNDLMVSAESGAVTIAGSPAANDLCFFQINNDVSASGQTGVVRLLGIKVFFTTDATNDA